jgi:hypothetical protein
MVEFFNKIIKKFVKKFIFICYRTNILRLYVEIFKMKFFLEKINPYLF